MQQEIFTYLPLIAVAIPLFSFLMIMLAQNLPWWRNAWSLAGSLGALAAVAMLYPIIAAGYTPVFQVPMIITPMELTFKVDGLGFFLALLVSFIWLAATVFAIDYMNHEENRGRFFAFFMLTLSGTVGVPLAGDFLSLLIFFEIMSLASYVLVIHTQKDDAMSAGSLYLYLGIFGGMALLTGMGLLYFELGTLTLGPQAAFLDGVSNIAILAGILMVVGFGIKAGMVPLHIWLPLAHPVAPAPASALLSGIMIKTGAYGILRLIGFYSPESSIVEAGSLSASVNVLWDMLGDAGFVIIWIGIITMFFGVCMAVIQDNIKKMLACSSISQIGYIIMGAGTVAYLGYDGAMGAAGATYHILNHAFFKSTLFLAAGAIVYLTGELDMNKLGGLRSKMPFTTGAVLISSLGIAGIPLFNGYASKTLLHHALVEAYEHHHVFSLYIAEIIFTITSAGTIFYFLKFLYFTFFRPAPETLPEIKAEPLLMKVSMTVLGICMLLIGTSPYFFLNNLIYPVLSAFTFDSYSVAYLMKINIWILKDLLAVVIALVLGIAFFFAGMRLNVFRLRVPYWLGAEFIGPLFGKLAIIAWLMISMPFVVFQSLVNRLLEKIYRRVFTLLQSVDYRPGQSKLFRSINISNIDFDMALLLVAFSLILIVVFLIRFGPQMLRL